MSEDWEENMNSFGYKMYSKLSELSKPCSNIFFGPASIYSALLMVYSGARGSTASELKQLLSLPENDSEEFHKEFGNWWSKILKENNGPVGCTLQVANRMWVKKNQPIEDAFRTNIERFYNADVFNEVDFFADTEGSREMINRWIEDKTNDKICNMIKENVLSTTTNFLVTSAMYFLGEWKEEFDQNDTKPAPFYTPSGEVVVDMMYKKSMMGFDANKHYDCKVCVIPYRNSKLRMVIICPDTKNGLPNLEERLLKDNFEGEYKIDWSSMQTNREVHIYIPRFKIDQQVDLTDHMRALGVTRLFGHADMSGMTRTRDIAVNGVSHAAYIDCNERGTEVAAATTSGYVPSGSSQLKEVRCDRPFLFLIGDEHSETVLFMGRINRPIYV